MTDDHNEMHADHIDDPNQENAENSDNPADTADVGDQDEVGYGRPPKRHQFPKGRSGNPKGRPKGARGLKTDLKAELASLVAITENGKTKKITKQQVVLKSLVAKAAKGDTKAASQVLTMVIQILGIEDERSGRTDLSPSELAILDSYIDGDGGTQDVAFPSSGTSDDAPELQTDSSGNGNHNNFTTTTVPDEESDDEPSC